VDGGYRRPWVSAQLAFRYTKIVAAKNGDKVARAILALASPILHALFLAAEALPL